MAVIGGGVGQSILEEHLFIVGTTWSPGADCEVLVTVVGGGGSGARAAYIASYYNGCASGGGAGGCGKSKLSLSKNTTYTITAGAGGAAISAGLSGAAGNAGGNSSFAGSGITTITANGGGAGTMTNGAYHYNVSSTGASGGSSSGGNIFNATGGGAGNVSVTFSGTTTGHYSNNYITGGGSVGLFGQTGFTSGAISWSGSATTWINRLCATGGAGLGGGTTDIDPTDSAAIQLGEGGPGLRGGTGGRTINVGATPITTANLMGLPQQMSNFNYGDAVIAAAPFTMSSILAGNFTGFGQSGIGVGGKCLYQTSNTDYDNSGGFFAGGGGQIHYYTQTSDGGTAWMGGGGGPIGIGQYTNASNSPGKGGDGFICIQILRWNI
jgi:hypothetical protein